jgi:hypothetical protein
MIQKNKAQVAMEFLTLAVIALTTLTIFFFIVNHFSSSYAQERIHTQVEDLGLYLQNELLLADSMQEGYQRKIFIPLTIADQDYQIYSSAGKIVLTYSGTDFVYGVQDTIQGSLSKGDNILTKTESQVVIS